MTTTSDLTSLLDGTLTVPEEHAASLPCVLRQDLFTDPLLDVSIDNDEFLILPSSEQHAQVAKKQAVERECVLACQSCPIVAECREWALRTSVHGVAGGMTESQRAAANGQPVLEDLLHVTTTQAHLEVSDEVIYRMTTAGYPTSVIADAVKMTERSVQRRRKEIFNDGVRVYRARTRPHHATTDSLTVDPHHMHPNTDRSRGRARSATVNEGRVSELTQAIFRFLADGAVARKRDDVIDAVAHLVEDKQAARPNGRRKTVLNRIRIAVREGRIESITHNGVTYLKLEDTIREQFHNQAAA